jgi:flagellar motor switch protein FliN/FliY
MTDHQMLLEIADRAIVSGAKNLTMLLGVEVEFGEAHTFEGEPELSEDVEKLVLVKVAFTEGIEGDATLAFTSDEAAQMVELMLTGMDYTEDDIFGELGLSALGEAMTQFVAGIGRSLGEDKGYLVNISTPEVLIVDIGEHSMVRASPELVVGWRGMIGPTPGRLFWTMTPEVIEALAPQATEAPPNPGAASAPGPTASSGASTAPSPPAAQIATDLGRLADVKLDVSVELGRSRIPIEELLALDEGGVIRLGRRVGEPVDLMVNGLATARGEIVVIDGRLGIRVTEMIA